MSDPAEDPAAVHQLGHANSPAVDRMYLQMMIELRSPDDVVTSF